MEAAEHLLETMDVDTRSYNIIINAWGKSLFPDAASHAELLLDHMEQHLCQDENCRVAPDEYKVRS